MLNKVSSKGIPCTYCDKEALPDTDPPVCEDHKDKPLQKKAAEGKSLKELEAEK